MPIGPYAIVLGISAVACWPLRSLPEDLCKYPPGNKCFRLICSARSGLAVIPNVLNAEEIEAMNQEMLKTPVSSWKSGFLVY